MASASGSTESIQFNIDGLITGSTDCFRNRTFPYLLFSGSMNLKKTTTITGSYTVQAGDYRILYNGSPPETLTLPSASTNQYRVIEIIDIGGGLDAEGLSLTIDSDEGQLDFAASYALTDPYGTRTYWSYNGGWWVIASSAEG
jgi:hypothetical protein